MGDAHEVVVHHVGKVIGGEAVPLQEDLVVQGLVLYRDVTEGDIVEGGGPLVGDALADDVGLARVRPGLGLLRAHVPAGIVPPVKVTGILLGLALFAEAPVGRALGDQELCIAGIGVPPLRLDIGSHRAADVGTLVVGEAALGHGAVDDIRGALHLAGLVGILDAEDEGAVIVPGDEPGIEGGAQVANVHVAGGGGSEPGADLALGDACFHLLEVAGIDVHGKTASLYQIPVWNCS